MGKRGVGRGLEKARGVGCRVFAWHRSIHSAVRRERERDVVQRLSSISSFINTTTTSLESQMSSGNGGERGWN